MRIILIEDDNLQADAVENELKGGIPEIAIKIIRTESEFIEKLALVRNAPPDVFIIDVMLRWTDPSPNMQLPPERISTETFYRAGFRCMNKLLDAPETKDIPIVIYSVLPRDDFDSILKDAPPHVVFIEKGSDERRLVRLIRSLCEGMPGHKIPKESWIKRIWNSIETKPGYFGITIDLKKVARRKNRKKNS